MIRPINALKEMATKWGCSKRDLLVLAPQNDPFNSGTESNAVLARWFASLPKKYGMPSSRHLRRWHYFLQSLDEPVPMPNGENYSNTEAHWKYLHDASRHARYMGLVDPNKLIDNRNPPATEYQAEPREAPYPTWAISGMYPRRLPSIEMFRDVSMVLPEIYVDGYDYSDGDQAYHLECWIEKSTMDDELDPLCREFRVTLVPGIGFQSVTGVMMMLDRCALCVSMGRPVRVFYISDFDPAGVAMPTAVARQIQFWLWRMGTKADIRLKPLMLTQKQIDHYNLPRKPIKDEDRRKASFEQRHGEGHIELDALAAIYPGEFERIVSEASADYRDENLSDSLEEVYSEATEIAEETWESETADIREELSELREQAAAIAEKYVPQVEAIQEAMKTELEPIRRRATELEELTEAAIAGAEDHLEIDLPARPEAEPPATADEEEWLFDSTRPYSDQVDVFTAHKNGEEP